MCLSNFAPGWFFHAYFSPVGVHRKALLFDMSFGFKNRLKVNLIYVFMQMDAMVQATWFRQSQGTLSKVTVEGDCSHEIKRHLFFGRKAMTNLNSILKSRDITLPTNVCIVKAMVFPVVKYGCESWTIKKAESLKN